MLKIAVCDDDAVFLQNAVRLVERWSAQSEVSADVFAYNSGESFLADKDTQHFDIILLDILMPEINGMEIAKKLRKTDSATALVFLTSAPDFALESYDVKAKDYILKPIAYDRLKKTLDECAATVSEPQKIVLKTEFGYQKLYLHNIEYAEAQNKRVIFYLKNGEEIESVEPLGSFEDKLTVDNKFFKCHRSYLVYMPNVDRFNSSEIVTKSGRNIPIARGHSQTFKEAYFSLMFKG